MKTMKSRCGCIVTIEGTLESGITAITSQYCSMHAAAPAMFKVLQKNVATIKEFDPDNVGDLTSFMLSELLETNQTAIKLAEGDNKP